MFLHRRKTGESTTFAEYLEIEDMVPNCDCGVVFIRVGLGSDYAERDIGDREMAV